MDGQDRLFDGYEIASDSIVLKPFGAISLELVKDDLDVHIGDMFETTIRFRIGMPTFGAPIDDRGNVKGQFARRFIAFPQTDGFEVTAYRCKSDLDAAWRKTHGAE